jgi:hypothetical protein
MDYKSFVAPFFKVSNPISKTGLLSYLIIWITVTTTVTIATVTATTIAEATVWVTVAIATVVWISPACS